MIGSNMLPFFYLKLENTFMNIIGAGLTGCIAALAFKESVVHEILPQPKVHKAVLRFRSDAVSQLTGIPFKKVTVYKGIWQNGAFQLPTIKMMNEYSRKVTGGYFDRSIANLSPSIRYIAPENFHQQMLDKIGDRLILGSEVNLKLMTRPVISTLPLPVLLKMLESRSEYLLSNTKAKPIYVDVLKIPNADVYQTIYYPDIKNSVYRASMTGDSLIIESVSKISGIQIEGVLNSFGFPKMKYEGSTFTQENGKFIPLDEDIRKKVMYNITQNNNIYSLGRHATWRKIMLDDVVNDIQRIEHMMKTSAYDRMLGRAK